MDHCMGIFALGMSFVIRLLLNDVKPHSARFFVSWLKLVSLLFCLMLEKYLQV